MSSSSVRVLSMMDKLKKINLVDDSYYAKIENIEDYNFSALSLGSNDEYVFFIDLCGTTGYETKKSMTNSAEDVSQYCHDNFPDKKIVYMDTMNELSEIKHENGNFKGFWHHE